MYAVIRKYKFDAAKTSDIAKHFQDGLLPLLKQTPGFVSYYWLDTGDGQGASLSTFDSQAGADQSVSVAADYVKTHLASILGTPEVTKGNVRAHS